MKKLESFLYNVEKTMCMIFLSIMTLVTFYAVFSRFTLKSALPWSEELVRYLFIWLTMIGANIGIKNKTHVGIEAITARLPKSLRVPSIILTYGICVVFSIALLYIGYRYTASQLTQLSPVMRINMGLIYSAIPIGALLMILNFSITAVKEIRNEKEEVK